MKSLIQYWSPIVLSAALLGCTAQPGHVDLGNTHVDSNTQSTSDADKAAQDAKAAADLKTKETVTPPNPLTGSYLYCAAIDPSAAATTETQIGCSLKSGSQAVDVNLQTTFKQYAWSYQAKATGVQVELLATPATSPYQQMYIVRSTDGAPVADRTKAIKLQVAVQLNANDTVMKTATVESGLVSWKRLDGQPIPANAIKAGSEAKDTAPLYICRVHYINDELLLGKMIQNFKAGGICYVNSLGRYIESNSPVDGALKYPSEVLVLDSGNFDELLEWVPATGTFAPDLAVTGGLDPTGVPEHMCRGLNNGKDVVYPDWYTSRNFPEGEWNPGELRAGRGCTYNYFQQWEVKDYQVLSWKSNILKSFMDTRIGISSISAL